MTTVKHALSVSLYEGIIFLSYFKEKRIKKCQRKDVEESVDKIIANRMSKAYSEWKSNQDTQSFNENIEKEYQKLLETLSPEQEKVLTKYCDEIFASGAEHFLVNNRLVSVFYSKPFTFGFTHLPFRSF